MIVENQDNRLGIFFFYDKDGVVDDYITYLLDDLVKSLHEIVIICNGKLTSDGRKKFTKYTTHVIVRENEGFDVWAYKTALDYVGWNKLGDFDEVVLLNSTIMGPVYPFSEMFEKMNKRDLDFWGITKYGEEKFDPFNCNPYGYIPEHIQSHFMAYRKSLVTSVEFYEYWKYMKPINSYQEAVGLHESYFTKRFYDKGFTWDVYVDLEDYAALTTYPLIFYPKELIEQGRCPIFKRRSFFQDYDYVITNTLGQSTLELYKYLKGTGKYDVSMIWQNVLRTCNQADIAKNLQLNYVVSTRTVDNEKNIGTKQIALVMHLYFPDLLSDSLKWASAMPDGTDVYITTNTEEKKKAIEMVFSELKCRHLDVRVIENRGRDVSSLLIGVRDVIYEYDYVCFVHDKKTAQLNPGSVGEGFAYKCFNNTLYNDIFVRNIINLFVENPNLGILSPPIPNHGDFFPTLGHEWTTNFDNVEKLAEKLGISVPMSKDKEHMAPLGTMFWFRPKALKPLIDYNWKYSDFPPEPNAIDGSILHAVERLYPFAAQQAGFYPAMVMADEYAKIEFTNLNYYSRNYNRILIQNNICNYSYKMREELNLALCRINHEKKEKEELYAKWQAAECFAAELYPKTSLKYQLKDRFLKLLHIRK